MGKVIGAIDLALRANTTEFEKGLKAALKQLGAFESQIKSFATSGLGMLGIGASLGGIASLLKGQIDAAKESVNLAKALSIPVDQLNGLQFAAKKAGGDAEGLTGALEKLQVKLGESQAGNHEALASFERLGPGFAESMRYLDTDEVFVNVIDRLHEMPNPMQRAAAAMGIFGKSWVNVKELIAGGVDKINESITQGRKLNFVLSEFETNNLAEVSRALARVGTTGKAVANTFLKEVGPDLKSFLDDLNKEFSGKSFLDDFAESSRDFIKAIKGAKKELKGFLDLWNDQERGGSSVFDWSDAIGNQVKLNEQNWSDNILGVVDRMRGYAAQVDEFFGVKHSTSASDWHKNADYLLSDKLANKRVNEFNNQIPDQLKAIGKTFDNVNDFFNPNLKRENILSDAADDGKKVAQVLDFAKKKLGEFTEKLAYKYPVSPNSIMQRLLDSGKDSNAWIPGAISKYDARIATDSPMAKESEKALEFARKLKFEANPFEKWKSDVNEIVDIFNKGLIDNTTLDFAINSLTEKLEKNKSTADFGEAMTFFHPSTYDPRIGGGQTQELKKANDWLGKIHEAIAKNQVVPYAEMAP